MRLIDANNLSKKIAKWCMGGDPQETEMVKLDEILFQVVDEIEKQPTAYDVEKVIMQMRCDAICPNCAPSCSDALVCGASEVIKQAIEIVRKGGVE